ncbi:PASTA domain-containing protein [Fusibacter bizertensis]
MSGDQRYLDTLDMDKPESFEEEVFIPVKASKKKKALLLGAVLLLSFIIIFILFGQNKIIPDMTGWTKDQIELWAKKNHKNTELVSKYSNDIPSGYFISQNISPEDKINSKELLIINISTGADPDEVINVPDLRQISTDEIKAWVDKNQLPNTTIRYESHATIPKDQLIDYEFVDGSENSFLRKNRLNIYISSGENTGNAVVTLPDFVGKSKTDAINWAEKNGVTLTFKAVFNEAASRNTILKQSLPKDSKMKISDELEIELSRGKEIIVPEFHHFSRQEASELAGLMGLKVFFKYALSDSEEETVFNQSTPSGQSVDETEIITLYVSKKSTDLRLPDFTGLTESEAKALAQLLNIKILIKNGTAGSDGKIINQSQPVDTSISDETIVYLEVDQESALLTVPNFIKMNRLDAEVMAKNLGLTPVFNEISATSSAHNTIIGQSLKASEKAAKGSTIRLDVVVNSQVVVPDLTKYTKNDAEVWAQTKHVTLKFVEMYSEKYVRGTLFNPSKKNKLLLKDEPVIVYYSLGLLSVPDFVGKSKQEVLTWIDDVNQKGAKITTKFTLDYHSTKPRGSITFQSNYNENIALNKELTFTVSAVENRGVQVPDFTGLNVGNLITWCQQNGIIYDLTEQYSDTYIKDTVYDQNYTNAFLSKDSILSAIKSLGKVYVPSFIGKTKDDVLIWLNDINLKGGDIKVEFTEQDSADPSGTILTQSVLETYVPQKKAIQITLSK